MDESFKALCAKEFIDVKVLKKNKITPKKSFIANELYAQI